MLALHLAERARRAARSRRGRDRTTARRAATAWARSSARGRPRRGGRCRGSATRPCGRRPPSSPSSVEHRGRALAPRRASGRRGEHVLPAIAPRPLRARSATRRCSRGDMPANSSMRWKVRPMPSRARRCVGTRVRSCPSKVIDPPSGVRMPSRQLKNVVLPAPFGPISPTSSRSPTSRSTRSSAVMPANFFVTPDASSRLIAALRPGSPSTPGCRAAVRWCRCRRGVPSSCRASVGRARATRACCTRARLRGTWRT